MLALIQEYNKEEEKWGKRCLSSAKRFFRPITTQEKSDRSIYQIPKIVEKRLEKQEKKTLKLAQILANYLVRNQETRVILSKELQKNEIIQNQIYARGIDILDGRMLFSYLSILALEYIAKQAESNLESQRITILINEDKEIYINIIFLLAQKIKGLNIITNNIAKFKKLENILYEEMGILITISNNKRKSLAKAEIILNLDFPQELVNQYTIYKNAILVNIEHKVQIKSKRFSGICINDYQIQLGSKKEEEFMEYDAFEKEKLYEAEIYRKYNVEDTFAKLKKDGVQIKCMVGKNGIIGSQEYEIIKKSQ